IGGNRLTLLLIFGPPVILWYLIRNRRPGFIFVILSTYLVLTVGIGFLRDTRSDPFGTLDSRVATLVQAIFDPGQQARALVLGADDEMFDSLANELVVLPTSLPFRHGATISDIAVRSVPRT